MVTKTMILVISALIFWNRAILVVGINVDDIQDYSDIALLALDVQNYFTATSIVIVHGGNNESPKITNALHHLLRKFSSKFMLSLTLDYIDTTLHRNVYKEPISRHIFLVLLSSQQEVDWFQQATSRYDMSYVVWIVFFTNATLETCYNPPGNYFNLGFDSEMLVKCQGDPMIREWYSVHGSETKMYDLATWDPVNRFKLRTQKGLHTRRRYLDAKDLPVVLVKESSLVSTPRDTLSISFIGTVFFELGKSLNFTLTIAHNEDQYGLYNESLGQWTEAIGRLARGEAELSLTEFSMTGRRLNAIDFIHPIALSTSYLYVRQPDGSALNWSAYFQVYTVGVWLAIKATCILSFFIITYMRMKIREDPLPPGHISENYLQVWGIYWQQGLEELPKASSMRIAYFSILLQVVVLYAVYSACLTSYLTVNSPSLPFNNLMEFVNDGSYKVIATKESAHLAYFRSSSDPVMKEIAKLIPESVKLPRTIIDGLNQVCAERVALYTSSVVKNMDNPSIPCAVVKIHTGTIDSIAVPLKKKSSYKDHINYYLLKFKEAGIIQRIRSKVCKQVYPEEKNHFNPVNFNGVGSIFFLLGSGIILSVVILSCEILVHRASISRAMTSRHFSFTPDSVESVEKNVKNQLLRTNSIVNNRSEFCQANL